MAARKRLLFDEIRKNLGADHGMLMRKAKSWFTGYNSNVAGHEYGKVRYLVYNGGTPKYVSAINEVAAKGYEGIVFSSQARISERPTLASNAPA